MNVQVHTITFETSKGAKYDTTLFLFDCAEEKDVDTDSHWW